MSKRSLFYKPRLECLELRETPAGNVTAMFLNGNLTLTGDNFANQITITQNANNTLTVTGTGTTVNGQASFTTPGTVINLGIQLNLGADQTTFDTTVQGITVAGNVNIISPKDADAVFTTTAGSFLTIGGNLQIINGPGNATTQLTNFQVTGSVGIQNNGTGNDSTALGVFADGTFNFIGQNLTIVNHGSNGTPAGSGGAFNDVLNTNVGRDLTINNGFGSTVPFGGGLTGTTNQIRTGQLETTRATVGGNLSITNQSGTAFNVIAGEAVTGSVGVANNTAQAQTVIGSATDQAPLASIGGNLTVTGTAANVLQLGATVPGLTNGQGLTIGGNLTTNFAGGLPAFVEAGTPNLLINGTTVTGTTSLTLTGNNNQEVRLLDSIFTGAFGLAAQGFGATTLNIQTETTTGTNTTQFNNRVQVLFGAGNDTVNVANNAGVPVAGATVTFSNAGGFINGQGGVNTKFVGGAGTAVTVPANLPFINFIDGTAVMAVANARKR